MKQRILVVRVRRPWLIKLCNYLPIAWAERVMGLYTEWRYEETPRGE